MAIVITMPPTISGSQVSMPVRAVVWVPVDVPPTPDVDEEELAVLELLLELLFAFEFEFDCAAATPASASVITTPRNNPANTRRATAPVVCTSLLPKTRLWMDRVSLSTPENPAPIGRSAAGAPYSAPLGLQSLRATLAR